MRLLALVATAAAFAQSPQQDPVIRSTTRLVQVNVVAQEKSGAYVSDLRQEEFQIFDNGKPQPLPLFVVNQSAPEHPVAPPPGTFSNQLTSGGGYAVILLDWLNTDFGDRAQSREKVLQMLRKIDSSDRIALYVLGRDLRVVHEFGGNREALLKKIANAQGGPDAPGAISSPYDASRSQISSELFDPPAPPSRIAGRGLVEEQVMRLDTRIRDTLATLEAIGRHLAGVKGRKSLIWVSAGIPTAIDNAIVPGASGRERTYTNEINRAIQTLNEGDVAVYAIDARGLSISPKAYINIQTMELFAKRSGGVAYANRNDIDVALRSALDDQRVSYTLGFYPKSNEPNAPHSIRVNVSRAGVKLRYRESYYPVETPYSTAALLRSPVDVTALPVTIQASRKEDVLSVVLSLDPTTLALSMEGGRWRGKVEIVPRFLDSHGAFLTGPADSALLIDMLPQTYQSALREGLHISFAWKIPQKAERIRVFVRDPGNGVVGSVTVPLSRFE